MPARPLLRVALLAAMLTSLLAGAPPAALERDEQPARSRRRSRPPRRRGRAPPEDVFVVPTDAVLVDAGGRGAPRTARSPTSASSCTRRRRTTPTASATPCLPPRPGAPASTTSRRSRRRSSASPTSTSRSLRDDSASGRRRAAVRAPPSRDTRRSPSRDGVAPGRSSPRCSDQAGSIPHCVQPVDLDGPARAASTSESRATRRESGGGAVHCWASHKYGFNTDLPAPRRSPVTFSGCSTTSPRSARSSVPRPAVAGAFESTFCIVGGGPRRVTGCQPELTTWHPSTTVDAMSIGDIRTLAADADSRIRSSPCAPSPQLQRELDRRRGRRRAQGARRRRVLAAHRPLPRRQPTGRPQEVRARLSALPRTKELSHEHHHRARAPQSVPPPRRRRPARQLPAAAAVPDRAQVRARSSSSCSASSARASRSPSRCWSARSSRSCRPARPSAGWSGCSSPS